MIKIINASLKDIPVIQQLAADTWWPTYSQIISSQQIRYMLNMFYSVEALQELMETGTQTFILLRDENGDQGFASFGPRIENPLVFKLHKLYVKTNNQGKGYGQLLVEEVKKRMLENSIQTLELNVNRYNPARSFYEKIGFVVIREEDVAIGPYWMNDYVMRLEYHNTGI